MAHVPGTGPLTVTLAEMAKYVTRDVKDAARWARHVDPSVCNGNHDWQCNKKACPTCWQPPCPENAEKEQRDYEKDQSGSKDDKAKAHRQNNDRKRKKGHEPVAWAFEEACVGKVADQGQQIEHIGYAAWLSRCHMEGDLDIVTNRSVLECKNRRANLRQMQENVAPIARKCFPGKQVQVMTSPAQVIPMNNTFANDRAWRALNVTAVDP